MPKLKILVVDEFDHPVNNTIVELYENENDWKNRTNMIKSGNTDNAGNIVFGELQEIIYFFYAFKDSKNNKLSIATHESPLEKNVIKTLKTTIY